MYFDLSTIQPYLIYRQPEALRENEADEGIGMKKLAAIDDGRSFYMKRAPRIVDAQMRGRFFSA
jgi:hypothetical protein